MGSANVSIRLAESAGEVRARGANALPSTFPDGSPLQLELRSEEGGLNGCLACGHIELYTQKDFPRRLGIALVVVAALLAPFTWYLSLVVVALIDAVIYLVADDVVVCYVCRAQYRGFPRLPRHPRFDREIEERLLYGDKAVMGRSIRDGGTANAPEPEH